MTSRYAASGLYVTAASGGGSAASAVTAKRALVETGDADVTPSTDEPMVFGASYQLDYVCPIDDIEFHDLNGSVQAIAASDTAGFRILDTVALTGDLTLVEEVADGAPQDIAAMFDATTAPGDKRAWIAHGRKRSAVELATCTRVDAEDTYFSVVGTVTREQPWAVCVDATNELLYTVTREGGVYCEDVSTPSTPTTHATALSLASYFVAGELLADVQVWEAAGEEVLVVLSTCRVFTVKDVAGDLTLIGTSEVVTPGVPLTDANPDPDLSVTALQVSILDRCTLGKDQDSKLVAYVEAQARGYGATRPYARVIVLCDLDLAGANVAPSFTASGCVYYNPYPTRPGALWTAYLATNTTLTKDDFTVGHCAFIENAGVDWLYVTHGKMKQVVRLDVSNALTTGIVVGAVIPCNALYSATPASNEAFLIAQIALDPTDFERFLIFESENQGARVIELNAGLETVASNTLLADTRFGKCSQHDIAVVSFTGPTLTAFSVDFRSAAYVLRAIDFTTATPTATFEEYWSFAADGMAVIPELDTIYMTTFGGVVPYQRATSGDPFFAVAAGYQPTQVAAVSGDPTYPGVRESNTEQLTVGLDVSASQDHRLFSVCGEGGFMEFKVTYATGYLQAPRFFAHPGEYAAVVGGPLDGWENADGLGTYYANDIYYFEQGTGKYIVYDLTNRKRSEYGLLFYRYNSGGDTWDFVTAAVYATGVPTYTVEFTRNVTLTDDFAFVAHATGFFVVDIRTLDSADTVTLVDEYATSALYTQCVGVATSLGRLFVCYYGPGATGTRGQVVAYNYSLSTGVVDFLNPVQALDSSSITFPTGHRWRNAFNLRFMTTNAGTGEGSVFVATQDGTVVEIEYDPAAGTGTAKAKFSATVTPNGFPANVYWRYRVVGDSSSQVTGTVSVPASTPFATVTIDVGGLAPSTDYEVRAYAYQTDGPFASDLVSGELVYFSTPAVGGPAPKVVTGPATLIGATSATLNARVNPNGVQTTAWFVVVGPTGSVTSDTFDCGSVQSNVNVAVPIKDLESGKAYTVQAVAENSEGKVSYGLVLPFTTIAGSSAPVMGGLTISQITATAALATVTFDTGGVACTVFVDYGTTTGYGFAVTASVAATDTAVQIPLTGLTDGTTYHARATITSPGLGFDQSDDETFDTLSADAYPTGDTALPSSIETNSVVLHSYVNPNGYETTVTFDYWNVQTPQNVLTKVVHFTDSGTSPVDFFTTIPNLAPFRSYAFRVTASNAVGNLVGQTITFRTKGGTVGAVCQVATTTPATFISDTSALVSGTVNPFLTAVSYYFEYWITGSDKRFTTAGYETYLLVNPPGFNVVAANATLLGLTPGATYNFRLCAVTAASPDVIYGTTRTLTTLSAPIGPPATGVVTLVSAGSSTTLFCRSTVNANGEDTDYEFEASTGAGFTSIAGTSASATVLDDETGTTPLTGTITGLSAATTYYVRMKMTHNAGPVVSYATYPQTVNTGSIAPPTVTTAPLFGATPTTLNAKASVVIPSGNEGGNVYVWFEYGTTSHSGTALGYDVVTSEVNIGAVAGIKTVSLQIGGPNSPPPLLPSTTYYCRAKARNDVGQSTLGGEVSDATTAGGGTNDPVPNAGAVTQKTPNSFIMEGSVVTNGSDTDITFQYLLASDTGGWASGSVVSLATQTITDTANAWKIGDFTGYLSTGGEEWLWRIKAVNGTGVAQYAYPVSGSVDLGNLPPTSFTVQAIQNVGTLASASKVGFQDYQYARVMTWFKHDANGRVWMQLIWTDDITWATYNEGRCISHQLNPGQLPGAGDYMECHYADYLENLTESTTYYYRLRCWSAGGDHTGAVGQFTTDAANRWSASWAASVGTRLPANNVQGLIPQNLRTGTGTIGEATSATDTTHDCDFGSFTYDTLNGEDAYSIFVTPTGITAGAGYAAAHGGASFTNKTQNDTVQGCNIAYAISNARIGDKIWIDGSSEGMIYRWGSPVGGGGVLSGSISVGNTVQNASGTWTGVVTYIKDIYDNPNTNSNESDHAITIRLVTGTLPSSGVPGSAADDIQLVSNPTVSFITGVKKVYEGTYLYQGADIGGSGTNGANWGTGPSKVYPVTGLRILALDPSLKPLVRQSSVLRENGGVNGVFFKNIKFTRGVSADNYCISGAGVSGQGGGGVVGFYDCDFIGMDIDGSLNDRGLKTAIKGDSPHTWDIRRCTCTPCQEHFLYGESWGEINPQPVFISDSFNGGALTNWDGTLDFNGRTFCQITSRGDHWQNKGTGSGFPPGRGTINITRCDARTDSTDGGGGFSIWGFHGTVNITDCRYLGSNSAGSQDSYGFLAQMDTSKGGWFNERGFATTELNLTRFTNNVNNSPDTQIKIASVERVTITDFFLTMNNKIAFQFLVTPGATFDNGYIKFILTYGTAVLSTYVDTATPRTFGWDTAVPWDKRMLHGGTPITTGTTVPNDPAAVDAFQNGVQYWAIH